MAGINVRKTEKKIAIIGAGISGLLACKHLVEKGFRPAVFESRSFIDGVWAQTIESTKLQTPKQYYQFSDFAWPESVTEGFPDHNQVIQYIRSYADHFGLLPLIKFNSKVVGVDYSQPLDTEMLNMWGGTGGPFSPEGNWRLTVEDTLRPSVAPKVYQLDFVILCIGNYTDLPKVPQFPVGKGPEAFDGVVIHSMDYAAMDDAIAAEFTRGKRVTIIGFQKSAIDIAHEIAQRNGLSHPCTMVIKRVHWTVPEHLNEINFRNLYRFSELMIHKPRESFFCWCLTILLSPLLWIFSRLVETYLKWIYPLKKYNMVPKPRFMTQVASCMVPVLPFNFYKNVKNGSLVLKNTQSFHFSKNGLVLGDETTPIATDVVIFATGYRVDEKIANIFTSKYFRSCILGSSSLFYRECIHPRIPQLAILGYSESPANLFTTEMRSKWIAHFISGKIKLPTKKDMEEDATRWETCMKHYAFKRYKRSCMSVLLQIYCNDQLCRDMGYNPRRKKWFLPELFTPYVPMDYADLCHN